MIFRLVALSAVCLQPAISFVPLAAAPRIRTIRSTNDGGGEPLNPELVTGDMAVICAAACYQQIVSLSLDGASLLSPVDEASFASVPLVLGGAALWGSLWFLCGLRHRVFSAIYATTPTQLIHAGIDTVSLRILLELIMVVATQQPTSILDLLNSNADSFIWLLTWRLLRSRFIPF